MLSISQTFHVIVSICNLAILEIFVFDCLAGSWILKFFNDFGCLITTLIELCFLCYCFLLTIFNHGLLTDGFAHSTTHASKTAGLEGLELSTTASHTLRHHGHSSITKSSSEKVVIIFLESKSSHLHSKICKWISPLILLLLASLILLSHLTSHIHTMHALHTSAKSSSHHWETATEEIVIIIEKICEWIFSSEEVPKYVFCTMHIEVRLMMETSSTKAITLLLLLSATTAYSSLFKVISTVCIVIFPFLGITQNLISIGYYLKYFFSLLFVIRVLIRVMLQWQFLICFLNLVEFCALWKSKVFVKVFTVEVGLTRHLTRLNLLFIN